LYLRLVLSACAARGHTSPLTHAAPTGLANAGQIVGVYLDASIHLHGFLLSNGQLTLIDYPGAADTDVEGINNNGFVSGSV
jgi:hypothetical protein